MVWTFDFDYANVSEDDLWEQMLQYKRDNITYWTSESAADPGVALMLMFCRMTKIILTRIRQLSQQNFLISATDRKAVIDIAWMMGKKPRPPRAAIILLTFTASGATVIQAGSQVKKVATETADEVVFETLTKLTIPSSGNWEVYAIHAESKSAEGIGASDGSAYQEFNLSYDPLIEDSLVINVQDDNDDWEEQDNLLMSGPDDKHFWVYIDEDDLATVKFGDGVNGKIPPDTKQITATYKVGGGDEGNVPAGSVTSLVSSIPKITAVTNRAAATTALTSNTAKTASTISVASTTGFMEAGTAYIEGDQFSYTGVTDTSFTGCSGLTYDHVADEEVTYTSTHTRGLDRETVNQLKVAIPIYNRTKTAAVSLRDYAILTQQHAAVAQAQAYQVGDIVQVAGIPTAGGYLSVSDMADVTAYIEGRKAALDTILVVDPLYVKVDCKVEVDAIDFAPFVNVLHDEMRDLILDYLDPLYRSEDGVYVNKFESNKYVAQVYSILAPYLQRGLKNIVIKRFCRASKVLEATVEDVMLQSNEIATYGTVEFVTKAGVSAAKSSQGEKSVVTISGLPVGGGNIAD